MTARCHVSLQKPDALGAADAASPARAQRPTMATSRCEPSSPGPSYRESPAAIDRGVTADALVSGGRLNHPHRSASFVAIAAAAVPHVTDLNPTMETFVNVMLTLRFHHSHTEWNPRIPLLYSR